MDDDRGELLAGYLAARPRLLRMLRRRTGCAAAAEDLTQESWLRAAQGGKSAIRDPAAFLRRVATNLATDQARASARQLTTADVDALLDVPDDAPTPEARAVARGEVLALRRALAELPERRRAIFVAARIERRPHREIAARFSLSTRMVEIEVRRALEHCALRLGRHRCP